MIEAKIHLFWVCIGLNRITLTTDQLNFGSLLKKAQNLALSERFLVQNPLDFLVNLGY